MSFSDDVADPSYCLQRICPLQLMYVVAPISFRRYKSPLSCEIGKKVVFGPRFVGGRDTPDFGHAFSNYTDFRPCARIWFSSIRRAQRLQGENIERKKEERKIPGKI